MFNFIFIAYYHELFLRGKPDLCHHIERNTVKGTRTRKPASPATEPNFYLMPFLPCKSKVSSKKREDATKLKSMLPSIMFPTASNNNKTTNMKSNGPNTTDNLITPAMPSQISMDDQTVSNPLVASFILSLPGDICSTPVQNYFFLGAKN